MKKFITTISLQGNDLEKVKYLSLDKSIADFKPTCFPIINLINNDVKKAEEIKIYAIVVCNDGDKKPANKNLDIFKDEIENLSKEKGFTYYIQLIEKSAKDDTNTLLKLFKDMIDIPNDNDEISACITYGTKPVSVITIMGLNYSYKVKKNVNIKNIVYGKKSWINSNEPNYLINVTPLFYIDCAIDSLSRLNVSNPEKTLKSLIDTEE